MKATSSALKLDIEMDLMRCGGVMPRLKVAKTNDFNLPFQYKIIGKKGGLEY